MNKSMYGLTRSTPSEHKTQDKEVYEGNIQQDLNKSNCYAIQLVTDPKKIKEYHLKRLYELSLKSMRKGADKK